MFLYVCDTEAYIYVFAFSPVTKFFKLFLDLNYYIEDLLYFF